MRKKQEFVPSMNYNEYGKKIFLLLFAFITINYSYASTNEFPKEGKDINSINQNSVKIKGIVKDAQGDPLIGVSISVKGTTAGTVTDLDGNYTIDAPNSNAILVVSYIGFRTQEIPLSGKTTVDIKLVEDTQMLNEAVVIGYGTMDKKELTSAISHISGKDLLNVGSMDPAMQMQGKVSGVSITNTQSGDPNSGANIQVRGISSRNAGLGPLIVIDGVPGGNLHNINSNDIASIDILKDGAGSAIYGTRGSNGVILVTTKKGSTDGKIRTEYND